MHRRDAVELHDAALLLRAFTGHHVPSAPPRAVLAAPRGAHAAIAGEHLLRLSRLDDCAHPLASEVGRVAHRNDLHAGRVKAHHSDASHSQPVRPALGPPAAHFDPQLLVSHTEYIHTQTPILCL